MTPLRALARRAATALAAVSKPSGVIRSLLARRRGSEAAHAAHLDPFGLAHRLHRQARVLDERHLGELAVVLDGEERHGFRHVGRGADVDAFPARIVAAALGMGGRGDAEDADDLEPGLRMIEEAE